MTHADTAATADTMARKVYELRILDDEKSAADVGAPVLVVSQFTLYGDARKGRRPTWAAAAPAEVAEPLVTAFADALRAPGRTRGDRTVPGPHARGERERGPQNRPVGYLEDWSCAAGRQKNRPRFCTDWRSQPSSWATQSLRSAVA